MNFRQVTVDRANTSLHIEIGGVPVPGIAIVFIPCAEVADTPWANVEARLQVQAVVFIIGLHVVRAAELVVHQQGVDAIIKLIRWDISLRGGG